MARRWRRGDDLERRLRAERPEAPKELVGHIVRSTRSQPRPRQRSRVAFAGAVTVMMLGTFASFGGLGYAASGAADTAAAVKRLATGDQVRKVISNSAAADQYRPKDNPAVVITRQAPLPGGSAGGAAGGAATGEPVQAGSLPFTGLSLTSTVALSLLLIALGVVLRRKESDAS